MAQLKIKDQGKIKLYEILEDSVYVGTSGENHIRVHDPQVAGMHLQIKKTRGGFKLIDLESKTGTKVNGEFVNQHILHDGDKIRIGDTLMKFEQEEPIVFEGSATRRRLERERGILDDIPTWGIVSIVGGGALLLAVMLLVIFNSGGPTYAQRQVQVANDLVDSGRFDEALELIKQTRYGRKIDPAIDAEFQRIETRIKEDRESKAELDRSLELQDSLTAVLDYAKEHGGDLANKEQVLAKFQAWLDQHPGAPKHLVDNLESNRQIVLKNFEVLEKKAQRRDNW